MKTKSIAMMLAALGCVAVVPTTVKAQVMLAALVRTMPVGPLPAVALAAPAVVAAPLVAVHVEDEGQVKDDLFAGTEKFAQGAKEVNEVNLDKSMLGMVSGKGGKNGDLTNKLEFVVVHSYEYEKPGMYRQEDVEVFRKRLTEGAWKCIVHTRDKDEATDVCMRNVQNGEMTELVVMTSEPKELTFVHIGGHGINLSDLSKMGGVMHGGPVPPVPPVPPVAPLNKR